MINQVEIQNFKSYQNATLKLAPLTLLIGANASGKSNAIEAIRFLSWLAYGRRLDDILQSVQQTDINIRGTLRDLTYDPTMNITLGCKLDDLEEWEKFLISVSVKPNEMRVVAESLESESSSVPLYWIKEPANSYSHEVQVAFNNFSRGGRKPTIPCSDRQAIFTQLDIPSRFAHSASEKSREIIPHISQALQQTFRQILFLDPIPRHMGGYSSIVDNEIKKDGKNISSVLHHLCKEKGLQDSVLDFIRDLPEQDIVNINFIQTPRNEVMIQLVESFGNHPITRDAPLLSDGTLRVLAVTAALLSAPKGSLIIIEEIDNGIHPSRAGTLLNKIQEVAKNRHLRVLLTSHNPALLDTLPISAVPNVVACYRDPDIGDSRLVRLEDLVDYPELIARGSLGQLMTKGTLDKFLKSQRSLAMKKEQGLSWLESLRETVEIA
ncbi:MAG: AAA family ATPase [Anaerolineales bacterium]|nr:AAA family ATPase [Anaerolineales bacterium]